MNKIPKIIHYCWFGGNEKPDIVKKCMQSWKKFLPEYKFMEWNESNFDVNEIPYTKQAYEQKKYAFVSDYVRLVALKKYGGVYIDTDVEILKPLDKFLNDDVFCGFESENGVAPGLIFGCIQGHEFIDELLKYYENNDFIDKYGVINTYTTVNNCTDCLLKRGLVLDLNKQQNLNGIMVYPKAVFCPSLEERETRNFSGNTYTVHYYSATWMSKKEKNKQTNIFAKTLRKIGALSGKALKNFLGEEKWSHIRNKYFKRLYNYMRGI